tara:strand:+ start:379 stop:885 length:507 start_codon:yes stop_codon:yes gene_type:complete
MFVKVTNGTIETYPYSVGKFRRDNPRVSFPKNISDEMLASYGVYNVKWLQSPEHDTETHFVEYSSVPVLQGGVWVYTPTARKLSVEQVAEREVSRAEEARAKRDTLLSGTDWQATTDRTMTGPELEYRQALRDLTQQAGFPKTHTWPTDPSMPLEPAEPAAPSFDPYA